MAVMAARVPAQQAVPVAAVAAMAEPVQPAATAAMPAMAAVVVAVVRAVKARTMVLMAAEVEQPWVAQLPAVVQEEVMETQDRQAATEAQ